MAKSLKSNLIEQHIEKIVLGVCFLLLVYVLSGWVLSSPREFAVPGTVGPGQTVKPEAIDAALAETAEQLYRKMEGAQPLAVQQDTSMQELVALQRAMAIRQGSLLRTPACPQKPPPVPPRMVEIEKVPTENFASKLLAPSKPVVTLKRELPELEPLNDRVTAHVAAVFNYGEWVNGWRVVLRRSIITPSFYILSVNAEVREKAPNGEWSEPRPVKMTAFPLTGADGATIQIPQDIPKLPADFKKQMEEYLSGPETATGRASVSGTYINQVFQNLMAWEPYILQPEYYNIWLPGHDWVNWRQHLPKLDVPAWESPLGGALDETAQPGPAIAPPPGGTGVPRAPVAPPRGSRAVPDLIPPMMEGPAPVAPRTPVPPRTPTRTPVRTPVAPRAGTRNPYEDMMPPMMEGGPMPARGSRTDYMRGSVPPMMESPAPRTAGRTETAEPTVTPLDEPQAIPDLQSQKTSGQLVLWFHDSSLANRKEYQFRVQLEVYNPLFCYPKECDKPEFAERMTLRTPFSEWSDKVSVVQPVEFFLAGSNESQRMVKVTVYAQHMGQYVKADFNLAEGHPVGETKKADVMNPLSKEREKRDVEFQSGATSVEFRFNVPFTLRGIPRQTVEMVYVDQEGALHTRSLARDRDDARRKELDELVKATAPQPVRPRPPTPRDRKTIPPRTPVPMTEGPMAPMYEGGRR